jgi:hypothetical protein
MTKKYIGPSGQTWIVVAETDTTITLSPEYRYFDSTGVSESQFCGVEFEKKDFPKEGWREAPS